MSVNDANANGGSTRKIKEGLESLIRQIYYISNNTQSTIILLEQFVFASYHRLTPKEAMGKNDYSEIYQSIASYYHILLWSIRDVYWTYDDMSMNEAIRYPLNPLHPYQLGNHPPWYRIDHIDCCSLYYHIIQIYIYIIHSDFMCIYLYIFYIFLYVYIFHV